MIPDRFVLQWHLTNRCNRRCSHCYHDDYAGPEMDLPQSIDVLAQFKDLLSDWRLGPARAQITLTGGEPFLAPAFFPLLERLAEDRGLYGFAILTNGWLIDQAAARHLARLRPQFVQVSVEGRPERHDTLRGRGDFARVDRAVVALKAAGVRTLVSFTAHRENWEDFGWVARWAWWRNVDRLWSDRLIPLGSGSDLADALLAPPDTKAFVEAMRKARDAWWRRLWPRGQVTLSRALQFLAGGGQPYHCQAGARLLTILPDGTVVPCRRLPIPVGHVHDGGGLRKIYTQSPLLYRLRHPQSIPRSCQPCLYARACRGGLRCLAYATTGDPVRRDPGCWLPSAPGNHLHRGEVRVKDQKDPGEVL